MKAKPVPKDHTYNDTKGIPSFETNDNNNDDNGGGGGGGGGGGDDDDDND